MKLKLYSAILGTLIFSSLAWADQDECLPSQSTTTKEIKKA